jgi:hypothetical protein
MQHKPSAHKMSTQKEVKLRGKRKKGGNKQTTSDSNPINILSFKNSYMSCQQYPTTLFSTHVQKAMV